MVSENLPAVSTSGQREHAILRLLRERQDGATAAEIFEAVSPALDDARTIQAYYKTLNRLEAAGRIAASGGDGARVYSLMPGISLSHAFTLDDIREAVLYRKPAAIIAAMERHNEYLERHRTTTLRRAGERLLDESDPADLVHKMMTEDVAVFRSKLEEYQEAKDETLRAGLEEDLFHLQRVYQRELGLTHKALRLPMADGLDDGAVSYFPSEAEAQIRKRVFGAHCISVAKPPDADRTSSVSGSDASVRFSELKFIKAAAYRDDDGGLVSINTSVAVEQLAPEAAKSRGRPVMMHSLPLTKEAIDDPKNRGMIMLRVAFPNLTDSAFEHAKKSATDVVQWRVDVAVFSGTAADVGTGEILPRPRVHLRDGTVVPQEREHKHYVRNDAYGEFTREGLRHTRRILQELRDSRSLRVFGGAVKSTQSQFFGSFINWYIRSGSRKDGAAPLDPNWELARSAQVPDHVYMTHVFGSLPQLDFNTFYTTFAIVRTFPSTTEYFQSGRRVEEAGGWPQFIEQERSQRRQHKQATGEPLDWDEGIDLEDDDFVYVCDHGEYASFYVGTTAGHPAPLVPRYEFLLPTGSLDSVPERQAIVVDSQWAIIRSIQQVGFMTDRDHNVLTNRTLVRILPAVIQQAHDACKSFGGMLERSLYGAVAELLSRTKKPRLASGDIQLRPADREEVIQSLLDGGESHDAQAEHDSESTDA
jgi:Fe2+ or Zn2+ uptake regulation protein